MIIEIGKNLYFTGEAAFSVNPHDQNTASLAYQSTRTFPLGFVFTIDGSQWRIERTAPSKYVRNVQVATLEKI